MGSEFEMNMIGELNFFLCLQIHQIQTGTSIHQQKYIKELLAKFGMLDSKTSDTFMATTTKMDNDDAGVGVDKTKYRGMIRLLLYLTASRPDIVFHINMYA